MAGGLFAVRPRLLALLAIAGFSLVVASSIGSGYEWLPTNAQFGLFEVVPLGYWLGLSLIIVSIVLGVRRENEYLFLLQVGLLFLSIWGAPSFFERYPSVWDSYFHYSSVTEIMRTGGVTTTSPYAYAYSYPGIFVLTASFNILAGMPSLIFLKYYPLFASLFTLLALYFFMRTYVPGVHYRYALLVAVLANVWFQFHFSPQSLGFAAGLLIFVFLERSGLQWSLAALALFAFVVVSHPTTVLFVIGGIVVRETFNWLRGLIRRKSALKSERPWPILVFLLIWVLWLFTGSLTYSSFVLNQVVDRLQYLVYLPETASTIAILRTAGNIFTLSPLIRTGVIGGLLVLALLSLLVYVLTTRRRGYRLPANVLGLFLLPLVIVPLDLVLFKGQIYDRGFLFLVLSAAIIVTVVLIVKGPRRLSAVVAALLILLASFGLPTVFYQEGLYVASERSLDASEFINQNLPEGTFVMGGIYPDDVWTGRPPPELVRIRLFILFPQFLSNYTSGDLSGIMVFDRTSELWYRQYGMRFIYDYYLRDAGNYSKVYDNDAYWIVYGG